jgi:hypothetical protein
MNPKTQRRLIFLGGLLFLFLIVLVLRPGDDPPAETPVVPSNRTGRGASPAPRDGAVTDVKLEALQGNRDILPDAARNPFRFEQKAPPPAPPRPVTGGGGSSQPVIAPEQVGPVTPPPPPPIPLRFIGFVESRGGGRTASFSDGRGNLVQGREGDTIEGRYRVLRVGPDSVELVYLDGRGRQTIRLSGQ